MKAATLTLTAGILAGAGAVSTEAAPTAGVSGLFASNKVTATQTADKSSYTTRSGVSLLVSGSVASANTTADKTTTTASSNAETKSEDISKIGIANVTEYVYIRSNPDANSEYVGKLYTNGAATVTGESGDWYQVTSGDVTGWINKQFLVVGDQNAINAATRKVATVTTQTLYVRKEASTESGVVTMVPETDDLTVVDDSMKSSGWVQVETAEGNGFVSTQFVNLSVEYKYAESKAAETARLAKEQAEREAAQKAALEAERKANAQKSASKYSKSSSAKTYNAPSGSGGGSVVGYASQFVGNPYVYGGTSLTNGTDCSGFVMGVYSKFGVSLPHSSAAIRSTGYSVDPSNMQPGDVVCYSGHVGIYAGNGQIVHAASPGQGITVSSAYYSNILSVRRYF
ncbi:MAG: C40 family peptidase [Lachnospiraceae bacterium]|nr:C40 family peptidase [Lachnospiraceae bacterium]